MKFRTAVYITSEWGRSRPLVGWTLALCAFAIALGVRFAFDDALPVGFPYLTFFPAVILTAFFAGPLPGIACAVACGLAAWYWFIPPFGGFSIDPSVAIALLFYICIVAVDIMLIELMSRSMTGLKAERALTVELARRQQDMLADMRLREKRNRLLQRELAHRMKNTLAMVQAVTSQSLRHSDNFADAATAITARIQALGRSQDMLTEGDWQATDILHVVASSLEPHRDKAGRLSIDGPPVDLSAMQGMGLALALHELATNAAKYGALSVEAGHVAVSWVVDNEQFRLTWVESGGPPVAEPERRGFGSRLIERVVPGYFNGASTIEYRPAGLAFTLTGTAGADKAPADASERFK